jgi:hypothetical protein
MSTPDPEQKPAPEIRGGDRPSDYISRPGHYPVDDEYEIVTSDADDFDREIEHPDHYEDADDE